MSEISKKGGWSWMGFLFNSAYFSGYGKLQKGLIMAGIGGLLPIFGIIVAIYGGVKAKKELPIKEVEFSWAKAIGTAVFSAIIGILSWSVISVYTPEGKINLVKDGVLGNHPSLTVGEAFDNYSYFSKTDWKSFTATNGRDVVEFEGKLDRGMMDATGMGEVMEAYLVIQFIINKDDTFGIAHGSIRGKDMGGGDIKYDMNTREIEQTISYIYNDELLN
ncbi:MAG: hypothetical protein ACLFQJ_05950 [Campylobacterales bacterium]